MVASKAEPSNTGLLVLAVLVDGTLGLADQRARHVIMRLPYTLDNHTLCRTPYEGVLP